MHDDLSTLKSVQWPIQIFHWLSFPITAPLYPRFSFNIQSWLCLFMCGDLSALVKSAKKYLPK